MNHTSGWMSHEHNIVQIRVPVPLSLRWINSYLLKDNEGYTIVDPGLNTDEAVQFWELVRDELQFEWSSIKRIIITHQHPDHYGLAGYIQQMTNAPVYISETANAYTERLWGSGEDSFYAEMQTLLDQHGVPKSLVEAIVDNFTWFKQRVLPRPKVTFVSPSDSILIDGYQWQCIAVDGHANGQFMLYDKERELMLCGDQVLPQITPHVGIVPGEKNDPLKQFLSSLEHIQQLPVKIAFPGHRNPFEDWQSRIEEIKRHHARRLQTIIKYAEEQKQFTAFQCCNWIFGKHLHEQPQQLRFAMTEIIAHLEHLVMEQKLKVSFDKVHIYHLA